MKTTTLLLLLLIAALQMFSQAIDEETRKTIILDDGTAIVLYGEIDDDSTSETALRNYWVNIWPRQKEKDIKRYNSEFKAYKHQYYYLPPSNSLRLVKDQNGKPKIHLVGYSGNVKTAPEGGLLSFSMEYGITKEQLDELKEKVKTEVHLDAKVMGAVKLRPKYNEKSGSLSIEYKTRSDVDESKNLVNTPAPIGENSSFSANIALDNYSYQIMESLLRNANTDPVLVSLGYDYYSGQEGFTAQITFDEKEYQRVRDSFEKTALLGGPNMFEDRDVTIEQAREYFNYLRKEKVIEGNSYVNKAVLSEERSQQLEEKFFSFFFESFTKPAEFENNVARSKTIDSIEQNPSYREGHNFRLNIDDVSVNKFERYNSTKVSHRINTNSPWVANANFDKIIGDINLTKHIDTIVFDNPLFMHRTIGVDLEPGMADILGKQISGVEVQLRKKKKNGGYYYFDDQGPLFFNKSGAKGKLLTYNATYDEKSGRTIEYKTTIKHKGGVKEVFDWDTQNEEGSILINSKLGSQELRFMIDPKELEENNIVAVLFKIRYNQFGKEKTEEVFFRASGQEDFKTVTLYLDEQSKAFGVNIHYIHKELKDPLDIGWDTQNTNTSVVYAHIPDKIKEMSKPELKEFLSEIDLSPFDSPQADVLEEDGSVKEKIEAMSYDF